MNQKLLLLEDVDSLGRKGELVSAKPGYVRNYLLPRGFAVIASAHTVRKQEILKKEREAQAIIDRKESEELARKLEGIQLEIPVKVDPEGHMYGSVAASDIVALFEDQGLSIIKKNVQVTKPIKQTGVHTISLKLKEDVMVSVKLHILPEGGPSPSAVQAQPPVEPVSEQPTEE